jgi:hypothetical protein
MVGFFEDDYHFEAEVIDWIVELSKKYPGDCSSN